MNKERIDLLKMKSPTSAQYRKAAELIFSGEYSLACSALNEVQLGVSKREMWRLFADRTNHHATWLTEKYGETEAGTPLGREVRIMALLFMSEITKGRG